MNTDNMPDVHGFVNTLYADVPADEAVILTYRVGESHRQAYYAPDAITAGKTAYVCVSSVRRYDTYPRRRKKDCVAAHVVMLDDVGTKAKVPPVEPPVILETSPGNCQYVYALERYEFDTPEKLAHYEAVVRSLTEAGYGDPGAGTATRVYRVPGSVNQKESAKSFETRILTWEPERKWTLDALVEAFGVKVQPAKTPLPSDALSTDVDDVVVDWLQKHNLVRDESDAWLNIRCPWADQHSEGGKDEAAYVPLGRGEHPLYRGFNCFHAHCISKKAPEFLAWVAENGGPQVGVLGVRDVSLKEFKELLCTENVDPHKLVWSALPELFPANLPDVIRGGVKQLPAKAQLATVMNVQKVCEVYGINLRFNLHEQRVEARFADPKLAAVYNATFTQRCLLDGCQRVGIAATKNLDDIIDSLAEEQSYHPFEEYVQATEWDGQDRIAALAASVSIQKQFHDVWPLYLRRWLIQCVQAACGWRNPSQMGSVLVLAGPQSAQKTHWFGSLVPPEFFSEGVHLHLGSHGHKDSVMSATSNLVCELGELEVTFQRSVQGALKAFLTNKHDEYRPPYGRRVLRLPRTTSFCASVNRHDFLMDETGDRRYWPVAVTYCNPDHGIDLAQLWAQVYDLWRGGEIWWLADAEAAQFQVLKAQFTATDAIDEVLAAYLAKHMQPRGNEGWQPLNVTQIAEILGLDRKRATLSRLRYQIEKEPRLGPRKNVVQGVRNAWLFPTPHMPSFTGQIAKPDFMEGSEHEQTTH